MIEISGLILIGIGAFLTEGKYWKRVLSSMLMLIGAYLCYLSR